MKEGNRAYCKKTYIQDNNIVFKKNKSYFIFFIDYDADSPEIWLYCEEKSMPRDYCGFLISGPHYSDFDYFHEYFYTNKELRKVKLQELNERK